jgi:hypothetical protein
LALAIMLPLTVDGKSKTTSTTAPRTSDETSSLTGSYVATAPGPAPLYLTLVQSGASLAGTLAGVGTTTKPPMRLTTSSAKVTGTVKQTRLTLDVRFGRQQESLTGSFSGASLTLDSQGVNVVFKRGTMVQFDALVARDRNSLLAQAALVASRAAESNLTNALTEAKALYQLYQSYSAEGHPYSVKTFTMQAPEFTWTTDSCSAASPNCISLQVMDVTADDDAQGLALAAFSPESSTCWYAIDIETTPAVIDHDPTALQSTTRSANGGVSAGVFFARSPVGSAPTSCTASLVLHAHHAEWADNYASAGGLS